MNENFPKHKITTFTLIQLQYFSKKHTNNFTNNTQYRNNSVKRGNLLNLSHFVLMYTLIAYKIHRLHSFIQKISQYLLSTMLRTVLGKQ